MGDENGAWSWGRKITQGAVIKGEAKEDQKSRQSACVANAQAEHKIWGKYLTKGKRSQI